MWLNKTGHCHWSCPKFDRPISLALHLTLIFDLGLLKFVLATTAIKPLLNEMSKCQCQCKESTKCRINVALRKKICIFIVLNIFLSFFHRMFACPVWYFVTSVPASVQWSNKWLRHTTVIKPLHLPQQTGVPVLAACPVPPPCPGVCPGVLACFSMTVCHR